MDTINYSVDADGIAILTIDVKERSMNVMTPEFLWDLSTAVERLAGDDRVKGAVERSQRNSVALQKYPEVESINHVHTGGNSSGIVDGSAAVLLGTKDIGDAMGMTPRARIKGFSSIGTDPTIMLTGPAPSAEKVLKRCGMTTDDIDLFELNVAFAAVVMLFMRKLGIDRPARGPNR